AIRHPGRHDHDRSDAGDDAALHRPGLLVEVYVYRSPAEGAHGSLTRGVPMKITIKPAHGFPPAQPPPADHPTAPVEWQYRAAAGEWETFDLVGLELPPIPIPPNQTPLPPHPPPIPPAGEDAFDLSSAIVAAGDCPQVAGLPIISSMAWIGLYEVGI